MLYKAADIAQMRTLSSGFCPLSSVVRKAIWFGVFWLLGIAASLRIGSVYVVYAGIALSVGGIVVYILTRSRLKIGLITALFAVCSLGFGLTYAGSFYELRYNSVMQYVNMNVTMNGRISDITAFGDRAFIIITGRINDKTPAIISAFSDDIVEIGDSVSMRGTLQKPRNVYTFNAESYYKTKEIFLQMPNPEQLVLIEHGRDDFIVRYREKLTDIIRDAIPDFEDASLFIAMLFGDRSGITDTQKDQISRAGISHIMAVSGAQLAIICTIAMMVCTLLGVGKRVSFFIMLIPLALFLLLAEDAVSIRRAAIMVIITYSGVFFSRRADTANSLAVACIIITAVNPFAVFDASFLLSAGGVFALAVLFPAVAGKHTKTAEEIRAEHKEKKIAGKERENLRSILFKKLIILFSGVKDIVLASAVVSVALLPICFYYFDSVSVIGVLTNVFMIPLSSAVVVLGMIVVLTGGIAFVSVPVLFLCGVLCKAAWGLTAFFAQFDAGNLPMGYRFQEPLLLLLGVAVVVSFILTDNKKRRIFCYLAAMSVFIGVVGVYRLIPSDNLNIAVLGDKKASAVVLHDKFTAAVIDLSGGGDAAASVKRYLTRMGITNISNVILTDHANLSLPVYKNALQFTMANCYISPVLPYRLPDTVFFTEGETFPILREAAFTADGEDYYLDINGTRINIMSNSSVKAESFSVDNSVTDENLCMIISADGEITYHTLS